MTFFLKPTISRRWSYWSWIPLAVFLALWIHGSLLGLSDDEAYYWVLAQKPALGYAYHPPAVAWIIAIAQKLFGWILGEHSAALVRLPSAMMMAIIIAIAMSWLRLAGAGESRIYRGPLVLFSFAGLFSLSWMMVPDSSLFFGWMLAFYATWRLCFEKEERARDWIYLGVGTALCVLSKYSGVLVAGSSAVALFLWASRDRRWKAIGTLTLGVLVALIPILIWNAQHEWASILYQIQERHSGGGFSFKRYLRFWGIELFAVGPILVSYAFYLMFKPGASQIMRFIWVWIFPAAVVFCLQPAWADFKPHWAFVVWWPAALALAWAWCTEKLSSWAKIQVSYGIALGAFVAISCHIPVGSMILQPKDPRLDVTNDLYGWTDLADFIRHQVGEQGLSIPVVGSRYQTASQAAFALGRVGKATLLPKDLKSKDEWPDYDVSEGTGPHWPKLKAPVLYVADNRYTEEPQYPGARCVKLGRLEKSRWSYPAKWIDVWRCEP